MTNHEYTHEQMARTITAEVFNTHARCFCCCRYVPEKSALKWTLKSFPGGKEYILRYAKATHASMRLQAYCKMTLHAYGELHNDIALHIIK